jgi:hypothetical protein
VSSRLYPPLYSFDRALVDDIPLVPIVFVMMTLYTSLVFWKQDKVQSRSLLGLSAVLSVFLSIMGGFGLVILTGKCNGVAPISG